MLVNQIGFLPSLQQRVLLEIEKKTQHSCTVATLFAPLAGASKDRVLRLSDYLQSKQPFFSVIDL